MSTDKVKENRKSEVKDSRLVKLEILFIALLIALVVGAYIFNFRNYEISGNPESWGQLGDYLGGVLNPLVAAAALIYLIRTFELQKTELRETRDALKESASAQQDLCDQQKRNVEVQEKKINIDSISARISSINTDLRQLNVHRAYLLDCLERGVKPLDADGKRVDDTKGYLRERNELILGKIHERDRLQFDMEELVSSMNSI